MKEKDNRSKVQQFVEYLTGDRPSGQHHDDGTPIKVRELRRASHRARYKKELIPNFAYMGRAEDYPKKHDRMSRLLTVGGGILGLGAGALLGGRNNRWGGALLGGLLGETPGVLHGMYHTHKFLQSKGYYGGPGVKPQATKKFIEKHVKPIHDEDKKHDKDMERMLKKLKKKYDNKEL